MVVTCEMETEFHRIMKQNIATKLKKQGYMTYQEPLESPYNHLWWHSYRPDVLATKFSENRLEVVLVECETKPTKKRTLQKIRIIQNNLALQKRLFQNVQFFPLLVIPSSNLVKILCQEVRGFWEIWIVNHLGEIKHRLFRKMGAMQTE